MKPTRSSRAEYAARTPDRSGSLVPARARYQHRLRTSKFLRFAVLSGCGWLLDFAVLLVLVRAFGTPPLVANIISSTFAASTVFLTSRAFIFERASGPLHTRFALFLVYTTCVILVASVAVGALAARMSLFAALFGMHSLTTTQAAAVAKIIVTPPQLLLNFAVSRVLSERPGLRTGDLSD